MNPHMPSLTAIKFDKEIEVYYEREIADGKHKLSIINAVKASFILCLAI